MTTAEWVKIIITILSAVGTGAVTIVLVVWKVGYMLGRQNSSLEYMSRQIEEDAKAKGTSIPATRPVLTTLTESDDPFAEVENRFFGKGKK